jgi:hypothetical protein
MRALWRKVLGVLPVTFAIHLVSAGPLLAVDLRVNFQSPSAPVPTGYVRDFGEAYGLRTGANQGGGTLTYGWVVPGTATPLDLSVGGTTPGNGRNRGTPPDLRLATLMHMQADDIAGSFNGTKAEGAWEIALPNDTYAVTVAVGDGGSAVDSTHRIRVEGQVAIAIGSRRTRTAGSGTRSSPWAGTARR